MFASLIFQHDVSPPRCTREERDLLGFMNPDPWTGRESPLNWPACSPDLPSLDIFGWDFVKNSIFRTLRTELAQLKRWKTLMIWKLPTDISWSVCQPYRTAFCSEENRVEISKTHCCIGNFRRFKTKHWLFQLHYKCLFMIFLKRQIFLWHPLY